MSAEDNIVSVQISQETATVPQESFSVPAISGPSNRFAPVAVTGNTVSGSPVITGISSTAGVNQGAKISGSGIPAGSSILSVVGSVVTISANATATASAVALTVTDLIRAYADISSMLLDGFQNSDPEVIRATELLEQALTPTIFWVMSNSASVAQITAITVNSLVGVPGHVYHFTFNGILISYTSITSDTQDLIIAGLAAAFAIAVQTTVATTAISGSGSGSTLTITSAVAGLAFAISLVDTELTNTPGAANHSIVSDIQAAQAQNDSWYGLAICSNTDADISQVAAYIETLLKIFIGVTNNPQVPSSSTTDLASVLKGQSLKRTALIYSVNGIGQGIEAAWLGGQLPQVPGSNNWAFCNLVGISPDVLTASQQFNLIGIPKSGVQGKNVNIYQTVGGKNITQMGTMIGGQFIDITIGIDWLNSTLQSNVFQALTSASKIPYTDRGTGVLLSAVKAAIDQGVANGLIDGNSPITISAPNVLDVPASQRANRIAPTISFVCRLAGAFNSVIVKGTVTV